MNSDTHVNAQAHITEDQFILVFPMQCVKKIYFFVPIYIIMNGYFFLFIFNTMVSIT